MELSYQQKFAPGIRIDYIFVSPSSSQNNSHSSRQAYFSSGVQRQIAECELKIRPWELRGKHSKLPLSDHEAVEAEIKVQRHLYYAR